MGAVHCHPPSTFANNNSTPPFTIPSIPTFLFQLHQHLLLPFSSPNSASPPHFTSATFVLLLSTAVHCICNTTALLSFNSPFPFFTTIPPLLPLLSLFPLPHVLSHLLQFKPHKSQPPFPLFFSTASTLLNNVALLTSPAHSSHDSVHPFSSPIPPPPHNIHSHLALTIPPSPPSSTITTVVQPIPRTSSPDQTHATRPTKFNEIESNKTSIRNNIQRN